MTWAEFKRKWARYKGKESSAYQDHFSDLCRLLGQPPPTEADPSGSESFCFQKRVVNPPEWTVERVLDFPGSVDGPWSRYVVNVGGASAPRQPEESRRTEAAPTLSQIASAR